MDAVEFLKQFNRMCKAYNDDGCKECPAYRHRCGEEFYGQEEDGVSIVEQWAKEHPVITRQNKLLNLFPLMDAIEDGCIEICPLLFDRSFHDRNDRGWCTENDNKVCPECKRRFWMEELKEGET